MRLALDAGRLVRADRLVDDLWATAPSTRGATRCSRRSPGCAARSGIRSRSSAATAATGSPSSRRAVDALAVLRDAAAAARLLDAGDDRGAADLSASALARYRGDLLPAAGDGDWARPHRARLDEARMTLIETQFAARLRLGDAGDVDRRAGGGRRGLPVPGGPVGAADHRAATARGARPTRWRPTSASAPGWRTSSASIPGRGCEQLEHQILHHDPSLRVADAPPRPPPAAGNLPSLSAELVGREAEIAALADAAREPAARRDRRPGRASARRRSRSPPGAADASSGAGGVWLVRLETATTADEVLDAVIAALDVTGGEAALLERLKGGRVVRDPRQLRARRRRGRGARGPPARRRARGCGSCAPARSPLDVDGEAVFELAPLALADAVELFTRRAAAAAAGADAEAVQDLCRSLDGLPLAIELAAARTQTLSIDEITPPPRRSLQRAAATRPAAGRSAAGR